jgi:hypothetical protein
MDISKNISEKKKPTISLDKVDSIEIVRSFSKTYQQEQYQPINAFASYKVVMSKVDNETIDKVSKELADKAENDVIEQIHSNKLQQKAF